MRLKLEVARRSCSAKASAARVLTILSLRLKNVRPSNDAHPLQWVGVAAEAGAGEFYSKCGFDEVGRLVYRTIPQVYHEAIL